jgi:hypothetical protein
VASSPSIIGAMSSQPRAVASPIDVQRGQVEADPVLRVRGLAYAVSKFRGLSPDSIRAGHSETQPNARQP